MPHFIQLVEFHRQYEQNLPMLDILLQSHLTESQFHCQGKNRLHYYRFLDVLLPKKGQSAIRMIARAVFGRSTLFSVIKKMDFPISTACKFHLQVMRGITPVNFSVFNKLSKGSFIVWLPVILTFFSIPPTIFVF